MRIKLLYAIIAMLLIAAAFSQLTIRLPQQQLKAKDQSASRCAVVHKPAAGCPPNYTLEPKPRFTERDGSKEFACVSRDPTTEPCTDVLKAGESETIELFVPVPDAEDSASSKDKL
jgi:hypothetical protein